MSTMSIAAPRPCTQSVLTKQVWFDSVDGLLDGLTMRWIGDNLGLGSNDISVTVTCAFGKGYLTLEETLRRIDQFDEYGRRRILSALPFQFHMPEDSICGGVQ